MTGEPVLLNGMDDMIATDKVKAAAELLMRKISEDARDMNLGALVIVVVDKTGLFTAYEMGSDISDVAVGNAVQATLLDIISD